MDDNLNETNLNIPPVKKKPGRKNSAWLPLILILAGVILLVKNLDIATFSFHWWALFIFIPVFASLNTAWENFQASGRFTASVRSALGSAVLVGMVAVILMFGMNWSRVWPLMVIAGGFSMFLSGLSVLDPQENKKVTAWVGISAWVGLAAMLLGTGFLVKYLPIEAWQYLLTGYQWWAIPILVAGFGILLNTLIMIGRNQWKMGWESWSMLLIAIFVLAVGIMAFYALNWNLLFPIVLIACGVMVMAGIFRKR